MTPSFLMANRDHVLCIFTFSAFHILIIFMFYTFYELPFFDQSPVFCIWLKALLYYTGRRVNYVWWFSPHGAHSIFICFGFIFVSGRLHRVECFYTLVLPSLNRIACFDNVFVLFFQMTGRFTGRDCNCNSRSPLSEPEYFRFVLHSFVQDVGEITQVGVRIILTLVLPSMKPKLCIFEGLNFDHILWHF